MRVLPFSALAVCSIVLALSLLPGSAEAQKLYRWTDAEGKVHYTDTLPPEAVDQARDELNRSGMAVNRVDRAMTAEERAALEAEAAEAAKLAAAQAEKDKMDAVLLGSYATEGDLERAYVERFDLLEQSLEAANVGIRSQEKSLDDLLGHAASLERAGKPVPATVQSSIQAARAQVDEQRSYLERREREMAALKAEYDSMLARYRQLKRGG
jgi:chromosome segregation ATPase